MRTLLVLLLAASAALAQSRDFDAASSHQLTGTLGNQVTAPLTLAGWVRPDATSTNHGAFAIDSGGTELYGVRLDTSSNDLVCQIINVPESNQISAGLSVVNGAWQHVACTFDGTNVTGFLDGTKGTPDTDGITDPSPNTISVGGGAGNHMDGQIAHWAVWTVELSDAQILELAQGVMPTSVAPNDLVAYWPIYGDASPESERGTGETNLTVSGAVASSLGPPVAGK